MLIKNCQIVFTDCIQKGSVQITNGKITAISSDSIIDDNVIDAKGLYLAPGFIDCHIHGAAGHDVMEGTYEALNAISKSLVKHGTTSFLPTTMTCSVSGIRQTLSAVSKAQIQKTEGAHIIGVHLEGPFINPITAGAQDRHSIQKPSVEAFTCLADGYIPLIKKVTLAPEMEGALELVRFLKEKHIVASIGHSAASYEEAMDSIQNGMSHFTHLYNAMPGFHHRAPGIIGAAFESEVTAEIICDGMHVGYSALRIALKQKTTDKMLLVSDAMMACDMPDGNYTLGGQTVLAENNTARLTDGTLAGSVLTLDRAVKNVREHTDYPLFEIIKMATYNPAKHCQLHHSKGLIKAGFDADLILFDENIIIHKVIQGGKLLSF